MKKKQLGVFVLSIVLCYNTLLCQSNSSSIQLTLGKSWHGTGDLNGIVAEFSYENNFKKRLSFSNGITTTIHYKKDEAFNSLFPGISPDNRLLRFTTAGLQLTSLLHYAILSFPKHKFRLDAGGILRFQSTSLPQQYRYIQDSNIYSDPFYIIYDPGKQNTFSVGYSFGLSYLFKISNKYEIGVRALFQNDTNSDAITQISLSLGHFLSLLK